ncbi:bacteriocin immunity protein [Streptomyces sp. T-3]|nr:bacteriocin immunity protein [Streptomyces sp. T-3]
MIAARYELIDLVQLIIVADCSEEELDAMIEQLEQSIPHPRVLDLIYHPEEEGFSDELTPEQVVDAALAYKPIAL